MRSSLATFAGACRDPDPEKARKEAKAAWHRDGLILINPDWLNSWADRKQAEILAEKCHGRKKDMTMASDEPDDWTRAELDFHEGYRDGRDLDAPAPSANRSHCYRHSFAVGRAEMAGQPFDAAASRRAAAIAEATDAMIGGPVAPGKAAH